MNIAIVHPYPVHDRAVGGTTRVYQLVQFLARRHRVSVFTHDAEGAAGAETQLARQGIIHRSFPRPSATPRLKFEWLTDPQTPYYVHFNQNPALAAALRVADAKDAFDVVHVELGYMAPLIEGLGPHVVRSLAEQEAMPLVIGRLRHIPVTKRTRYEQLAVFTAAKVAAFDRRTLPGFDLLYGITAGERDYLSQIAQGPAAVLPHVVTLSRFPADASEERAPATILFVGNFQHRPNVHAAEWFVRKAWPIVRARVAAASFEIVGAGVDRQLASNLAGPGVMVRGYQDDLAACYRHATVVVTPVHSGGGMRGKVLEAFAAGCASVSTMTGLEGIAAQPGEHCLTGETPEAFADAVTGYLQNPALRRAHGTAARALVAAHYDAPAVFARLEQDFEHAVRLRANTSRADRTPHIAAVGTIA
jgi:glycosyltransferase involved in cell wall biosynthesis